MQAIAIDPNQEKHAEALRSVLEGYIQQAGGLGGDTLRMKKQLLTGEIAALENSNGLSSRRPTSWTHGPRTPRGTIWTWRSSGGRTKN